MEDRRKAYARMYIAAMVVVHGHNSASELGGTMSRDVVGRRYNVPWCRGKRYGAP